MSKQPLTVGLTFLLVAVQLALAPSYTFAQDPVHANAVATLDVNITISGLSSQYLFSQVAHDSKTTYNITATGGKPKVGDTIIVSGVVSDFFYARGRANSSVNEGNVAAAGAIGGIGWIAGAMDPAANMVAMDGGIPVVAASGALAARGFTSEPVEIELAGVIPIPADLLDEFGDFDFGDVLPTADDLGQFVGALAIAAAPDQSKAKAEAQAGFTDSEATGDAYAFARVKKDGGVRTNAEAAGGGVQNFSFSLVIDRTGQWTISGGALSAALAGSALLNLADDGSFESDYDYDWAVRWILYCLSFWVNGLETVSEWKPVGEHIVFVNLPANTRWADLRRLELDGRWAAVPPLKPADQLPSPVHADLMIHGYAPCAYALRVCDISGACQPPRYFTVKWTGSDGVQIYDYAGLSATSPAAAAPAF